jgi:DNA-binding MarR family transcriptional regulator
MDKAELIKEIIKLQKKIDRARRQYELDVWMNLPITIGQLKSLFFISNQGSTNLGKLAAALRVTSTNTTGIIDRLVKQGLVSRTEDAQDRRMLLLRVTEEGERLVTQLREKRRDYRVQVMTRMNIEELTTLAQGLTFMSGAVTAHEAAIKDEHG